MLVIAYNIAQLIALFLAWPLLLVFLAVSGKRRHLMRRLGFGLACPGPRADGCQPTFWLHALSVGEATSAVSLVHGLRHRYPQSRIIITASTASGQTIAADLLADHVDHIFPAPIDLLPVIAKYIRCIQPDMFILVETDYWPNLLSAIARRGTPMIVVNGRISRKSFISYRRFRWFFTPMFQRFSRICLQTEEEKAKFLDLGASAHNLLTLGNLKYDLTRRDSDTPHPLAETLPHHRWILTAGSTHRGEEREILEVYRDLRREYPQLYLILVPRRPERAEEILALTGSFGLKGHLRSRNPEGAGDLLIVDTIGELLVCYRHSQLALVGGSMVAEGGHNPIEPASLGVPVLFGKHMEDFQEISADLLAHGGARRVADRQELADTIRTLLTDEQLRQQMAQQAKQAVNARQGVVARHLELIENLLD